MNIYLPWFRCLEICQAVKMYEYSYGYADMEIIKMLINVLHKIYF